MPRPSPSRRSEHGTLLEKQCLVAVLCVAGALLGPRWRPAFLLIPLGLLLAVLPTAADLLEGWIATWAARRRMNALRASGVQADLVVRAPASMGGARLAVDRTGRRLAHVTADGAALLGWAEVAGIVLEVQTWTSFGRGSWTRYVLRVEPAEGAPFGLSFTRLGRARRAYRALAGALGDAVPFRDGSG